MSGTIHYAIGVDSSISADLIVKAPDMRGGTLHIDGNWLFVAPVSKFKVSGSLGGRNVAVLVPEA